VTVEQSNADFIRLENSFGNPCTLDREDVLLVLRTTLRDGLISDDDVLSLLAEEGA